MRKFHEENERIKRRYFLYLKEAKQQDPASVDKASAALHRFEKSTGYISFKAFHIDQAVKFKKELYTMKNQRTGGPLSKATISSTLRPVKTFFVWLAGQQGYKSRIRYADAEYFNMNAKDERVAHAKRETPSPTLPQALHAFRKMPSETEVERRNRAIFAILLLTGVRDGALISLRLKHVDLIEKRLYQDAREVTTKASKTFESWFFPMPEDVLEALVDWVEYLRTERLFGNDDPIFPRPHIGHDENLRFKTLGVSQEFWTTAGAVRRVVKLAFAEAAIQEFAPHSFRKTLVQVGQKICKGPEDYKAWSQNLGHDSPLTTFTSYGNLLPSQQGDIITSFNEQDLEAFL